MPKSEKPKAYSIDELSPEARALAIERFRERGTLWDSIDSDSLTEFFEELLEDKGIEDPEVHWSLGYGQGDGVNFSGGIDIPKVIKDNKLRTFKKLADLALSNLFYARVDRESGRSFHRDSMQVETKFDAGREYFMINAELRELEDLQEAHKDRVREWRSQESDIAHRNMAPIRRWEAALRLWEDGVGAGPREWSPRMRHPGVKPEPLNEPVPPQPVALVLPPHLQKAIAEATAQLKKMEDLSVEFQRWLKEWVRGLSGEMEKSGYAEIEYRESDEAIAEFFQGNEWKFRKDGERMGGW